MILNQRPGSELLGGPRGWGRGRNSTYSEYGHVAYQINLNHECSNMVANILLADPLPLPPLDPGGWDQKVKIQVFLNIIMLHI